LIHMISQNKCISLTELSRKAENKAALDEVALVYT
jgi:hypothetical protein